MGEVFPALFYEYGDFKEEIWASRQQSQQRHERHTEFHQRHGQAGPESLRPISNERIGKHKDLVKVR